jgi:hypothetical protein
LPLEALASLFPQLADEDVEDLQVKIARRITIKERKGD